jgi:hypothetical protein
VCPVRFKIVPDPASMKASIYISDDEHEHPEPKTGISLETKKIIRELFFYEKETRPTCIQKRTFEKKVKNLSKVTQIQTFIRSLKSEQVQNISSFDQLYAWCKANEKKTDDKDKMFCPTHKISRNGSTITSLCLFLTNMSLISQVEEDRKFLHNQKKNFFKYHTNCIRFLS